MSRKKILIVDDEEKEALQMQKIIEDAGKYEVHLEHKSSRVLSRVQELKPDFVFLDIKMPELNGFDVMQQLKADDYAKNIPVVFLTGALTRKGPTASPADDHLIGVYPYLVKPATSEELLSCIEKNFAAAGKKN